MIGREKYLDQTEVARLRTSAQDHAFRCRASRAVGGMVDWMIVDLALSTGLRVSEMVRITFGDVDLDRKCIRVTRSKKRKVPKPEWLAVPEDLIVHLREYVFWCRVTRRPCDPTDNLICGQRGPMEIRGFQKAWGRAIRRAKIVPCGIHAARHTLATHLLRVSKNLRMVQHQLGHASPVITANMYAHVQFDELSAALSSAYKNVQNL